MRGFLNKLRRLVGPFGPVARLFGRSKALSSGGRPLVKPRPESFMDHYQLVKDRQVADQTFGRLKRVVYRGVDVHNQFQERTLKKVQGRMIREAGSLPGKRSYFYVQPMNDGGWLFECTDSGWVVSKAQKIVGEGRFLRSYEAWDVVTLYSRNDGSGLPRVSSQRMNSDLVSISVYEQKLMKELPIHACASS